VIDLVVLLKKRLVRTQLLLAHIRWITNNNIKTSIVS